MVHNPHQRIVNVQTAFSSFLSTFPQFPGSVWVENGLNITQYIKCTVRIETKRRVSMVGVFDVFYRHNIKLLFIHEKDCMDCKISGKY